MTNDIRALRLSLKSAEKSSDHQSNLDPEAIALKLHPAEAKKTYRRGKQIKTKSIKDRKLRHDLNTLENKYHGAALQAKWQNKPSHKGRRVVRKDLKEADYLK